MRCPQVCCPQVCYVAKWPQMHDDTQDHDRNNEWPGWLNWRYKSQSPTDNQDKVHPNCEPRVAQNAPNRSDLPSQLIFPSLLPSWWGKCIESPKKLMPRGSPCEAPFWPDFIRGCTPTNDIFWSKSFLTPLIAWKTPTNIGKQLCIYQSPTRGPKSTKIELLDQILALWSDLEHCFDFSCHSNVWIGPFSSL